MNNSRVSQANSYSLLATLCQPRGVLSAFVVGESLALIVSFATSAPQEFWLTLGFTSIFIQFIVFISLFFFLQIKKYFPQLPSRSQGACVISVTIIVTVITCALSHQYSTSSDADYYWFILKSSTTAAIVSTLFVQFMQIYNEQAQAHSAYASAALDALQARIRPHFLFNSLNTLAELAHQDAQAAEESALALAQLSRAAMHAGENSTLEDEVALAKRYITLESWRFGARLKVSWDVPDQLEHIYVPMLTLQPLLENAVLHGVEPSPEGGWIKVGVTVTDKSATVVVTNSVYEHAEVTRPHTGIALKNIRQRLGIIFSDRASLVARQTEQQYWVKLVIPREKQS